MKASDFNWQEIKISMYLSDDEPSISIFNYKQGRCGHGHIRSSIDEAVSDVEKFLKRKYNRLKIEEEKKIKIKVKK